MANLSPANIVIFFTISLLFTSIVTAWLLLQAYGITVSGIPFEVLSAEREINLSSISEDVIMQNGDWTFGSSSATSAYEDSYILFKKVITNADDYIVNTYYISNPNQGSYSTVLDTNNLKTIEVKIEPDGYHVVSRDYLNSIIGGNEIYFYPDSSAISGTDNVIRTEFCPDCAITQEGKDIVKFYKNGEQIFSVPYDKGAEFGVTGGLFMTEYLGGIGNKDNIGLSLSKFSTDSSAQNTGLDSLMAYIWTLLKILTWGIEPQFLPYELNLLLIKSQEFAIGVGLFGFARG